MHFEAKLENYLFFILNMLFGIVFCFQIPIILLVLNLFNIFKRNEQILINRKIIYLFIIIIGTFISSPDILNQFFIFSIFLTGCATSNIKDVNVDEFESIISEENVFVLDVYKIFI